MHELNIIKLTNEEYLKYTLNLINGKLRTKKEIDYWVDQHTYGKVKHNINNDLTVDIYGSIDLTKRHLETLPIQFSKVLGNFDISNNKLTTLKGCPYEVEGDFICNNNYLVSLEHAPKKIGGSISIKSFNNNFNDPELLNLINDTWLDLTSNDIKRYLNI